MLQDIWHGINYHRYIRSSEAKSNVFAISGEVKTPFADAATENSMNYRWIYTHENECDPSSIESNSSNCQ